MRVSSNGKPEYQGKEILKIYIKTDTLRRINSMAFHAKIEPWQMALRLMQDGLKWREFSAKAGSQEKDTTGLSK